MANKLMPTRDCVTKPQNNFNQILISECYESTEVDRRTWLHVPLETYDSPAVTRTYKLKLIFNSINAHCSERPEVNKNMSSVSPFMSLYAT